MRDGSATDALWVRGLCHAWSIPLDMGAAASAPRNEAHARALRYHFLAAAADRCGALHIATAHQADDQAETVLFRLARGTGLRGLAGIPERRGRLVRPLLPWRRDELVAYAARARLLWREDPTNTDPRYARNRVRHILLPAFEYVRPGAVRSLLRLSAEASLASAALDARAERALDTVMIEQDRAVIQLARAKLLGYHPLVRARILRRAAERVGRVPGRAGTRAALAFISEGTSGGAVDLGGGLRLERHFDRLWIRQTADQDADEPLLITGPGNGQGVARIAGRRFRAEWSLTAGATEASMDTAIRCDPNPLRFPLELRAWQPGDRIRLAGGTKKLKKLFAERQVPRPERSRLPLLADAGGRVLWIAGVAAAALTEPEPGRAGFQIRVTDADDE
jgi:tRNA(Ile)-lysidine synthetase-like protein